MFVNSKYFEISQNIMSTSYRREEKEQQAPFLLWYKDRDHTMKNEDNNSAPKQPKYHTKTVSLVLPAHGDPSFHTYSQYWFLLVF